MSIASAGFPEFLGPTIIVSFVLAVAIWLVYCISSVARAADALERIADAMKWMLDEDNTNKEA